MTKWKSASVGIFSICRCRDYEWDEDYNNFDKDDVGEDGTWNRVQFGWQIGATLDINKFNVGIGYALDFNEIAEKDKMRYLLRSLRFQFLNRHLTRRISTETRHKRHVSVFIKVNQYLFL